MLIFLIYLGFLGFIIFASSLSNSSQISLLWIVEEVKPRAEYLLALDGLSWALEKSKLEAALEALAVWNAGGTGEGCSRIGYRTLWLILAF